MIIQTEEGDYIFKEYDDLNTAEQKRIQQARQNDLLRFQTLSTLTLIPIGLLSFTLGYIISGRFLNPINSLALNFENLSTKDLGKTIPIAVDDEVGKLIESFNRLSVRLKESFAAQEQFVQDASHELKTPLTVIQTNLDTVVDDESATKQELNTAIKSALDGMKHLRKLTTNLLELSEPSISSYEKAGIANIITTQIDLLKEFASQNKVKVNFSKNKKDVYLKCNPLNLGRAIFNIIENGIKYSRTSKNPAVEINLEQNKNNISVIISNNGEPISSADQVNIFKRFFRSDKSRNSNNNGFGLGLAIANKIVEAHGGKILVSSTKAKTSFSIIIPNRR